MLTELKLETNRHGMARNVQVRPRLLDYSRAPSRLVVDSLSSSSFLSFFFWNRVEPSSLFRQPTIDLVSLGFFFFTQFYLVLGAWLLDLPLESSNRLIYLVLPKFT